MKIATYVVLLSLVFFLSGCVTKEETSGVKTQLLDLQNSLSQTNQRLTELEYKVETMSDDIQSFQTTAAYEAPKMQSEDFIKKVQLALAAAGFNPGSADGKMGPKTIQAVKKFQEANDIKANGIVDVKTWEKLQGYLNALK